jgi:hypothetical protein
MIDEADVKNEFLHGPLTFRGAVQALIKWDYDPIEAERIVSEWAKSAELDMFISDGDEA